MKKYLIAMVAISSASISHAQDSCELGLDSAYLTDYFCSALSDLAGDGLNLRSMTDDTGTSDEGLDPMFAELQLFQDAYRTDPAKTLELIERIRNAGGLLAE